MHLESQDFEVDLDILLSNKVDSDQLASGEDRAIWASWELGWRMECYLKREIDIEMGHEMEGSICAEDEFCWSEVVFLF